MTTDPTARIAEMLREAADAAEGQIPRPGGWTFGELSRLLRQSADLLIAQQTALKECVAYEAEAARYAGLAGCTCITISRDRERDYETGCCPHQIARAVIAKAEAAEARVTELEAERAKVQ